ncbi:MAG: TlpA disulfide reductase family protein [Bacteroidota bacterium]
MNSLQVFLIGVLLCTVSMAQAQKMVPEATVVNGAGESVDLVDYLSDGNPKIVSLWATWCGPCRMELNAIKKSYPRWKEKYNAEVVAISVDNPRMVDRAKKMFASNEWEYTFLFDQKQELMRKFGIRGIPFSIIVDGEGQILSTQMGYSPGYEDMVEDKLKSM